MRKEIQNLVELGRLPSEEDASYDILRKLDEAFRAIERPIRDEEADALLALRPQSARNEHLIHL